MAKIYVIFEFVNKNGKKRRVRFPIDKQSYDAYHLPSVPEEWTQRMMLEDYKEYCAKKRYEKKTCRFPVDDDGNEMEFPDDESETPIEVFERKEERALILSVLSGMTKMQRKAFVLVYLEGYSQCQASRLMKVEKGNLAKMLRIAEKKFEINLKRKNFQKSFLEMDNFWGSKKPIK